MMKSKGKTIVILDANNILYRANFVMGKMSYKGKPTGAIFGFLNILSFIIRRFKPYKLYVVWDGQKHKARMECLKGYKGHRKQDKRIDFDPEVFQKQKRQVQKLLDLLGVKQALNPKGEADDLIYQLVEKWKAKTKKKILIVSNDKDFNQCITKQVRVWNDNKKLQLTHLNLKKHYGYHPYQTVDYLTLVGDKSDDIPGYRGIGEKTAKKILEQYHSLHELIRDKMDDEGLYKTIIISELQRLMGIAQIMIDLKYFHENYSCKLLFINKKPKYDKVEYCHYATKFGFREFIKPEFLKLFK